GDGRAQHTEPVGAAFLVEATILDRDGRLRYLRVDPRQRHRLVNDRGAEGGEARPVGGVQVRAPADAVQLQRVEIAGDEEVRAAPVNLQRDGTDERRQQDDDRDQPLTPPWPFG